MKVLAALTGSAMLPSSLLALDRHDSLPVSVVKIGILLPSSTLRPTAPKNLLAGFSLGLDHFASGERKILMCIEDIGVGQSAALEKACKLVETDGADMVIGFVNPAVSGSLAKLFGEDGGIPFVSANMGEFVGRSDDGDPSVLRGTLQYWQTHLTMGAWAAQQVGKTAYLASSLYDSGYDSAWAFQLGFESAGGEIVGRSLGLGSSDVEGLCKAIAKTEPDLVYGLYGGKEAVDFIRAYSSAGLSRTIQLAGSGFMVDDDNLRRMGDAASGVLSCFSWSPNLDSPENHRFLAGHLSCHGLPADAFSLLGYETAAIVMQALPHVQQETLSRDSFKDALSAVRLISPRGQLAIDAGSGAVSSHLHIRQVVMQQGQARNREIAALAAVAENDRLVEPMRLALRTGWNNAYMCV